MFIDTHCHLNFKDFQLDADKIIKKVSQEKMALIVVGVQETSIQRAIKYAERYNNVYASIGLHPIYLMENTSGKKEKFDFQKYLNLAKNKKVVAIGEVGLDYHHFDFIKKQEITEKEKQILARKYIVQQKKIFLQFIKIANQVKKPLIIHTWNADKKDKNLVQNALAYDDLLKILKEYPVEKRGVVHSFIGSYKVAQEFIKEGFFIGLNGIITYSKSYDKLIKKIGLKNILIETDAPYLTPQPLQKKSRNNPLNVKLVAQKIAQVLNISVDKVAQETTQNAQKLFQLSL